MMVSILWRGVNGFVETVDVTIQGVRKGENVNSSRTNLNFENRQNTCFFISREIFTSSFNFVTLTGAIPERERGG